MTPAALSGARETVAENADAEMTESAAAPSGATDSTAVTLSGAAARTDRETRGAVRHREPADDGPPPGKRRGGAPESEDARRPPNWDDPSLNDPAQWTHDGDVPMGQISEEIEILAVLDGHSDEAEAHAVGEVYSPPRVVPIARQKAILVDGHWT